MIPCRIIIHHSATEDGGTYSWGAIHEYHTLTRGWADIGYHAGVELVDRHFACLLGRPWDVSGAHAQGHNHDSLGFCFVGDYDKQQPPELMVREAVRRVIAPWCRAWHIPPANIIGHRDVSSKTCPGRLFDLGALRHEVELELGRGG